MKSESEIQEYLRHCAHSADDCSRFLFFTRGKELQQKAREALEAWKAEVEEFLRDSQTQVFEELSNQLRGFLCLIHAFASELDMYIALKEDEMGKAWDFLITAQMAALSAMRAHAKFEELLGGYASNLEALEHALFPPQMFFSSGMTVTSSECSICHSEYRECPHIKGRIYNGEFCSRWIKGAEIEEVSIVEEPADKRCRALTIGEGEKRHDVLTLRKC